VAVGLQQKQSATFFLIGDSNGMILTQVRKNRKQDWRAQTDSNFNMINYEQYKEIITRVIRIKKKGYIGEAVMNSKVSDGLAWCKELKQSYIKPPQSQPSILQ
jgi:hypothetical protein